MPDFFRKDKKLFQREIKQVLVFSVKLHFDLYPFTTANWYLKDLNWKAAKWGQGQVGRSGVKWGKMGRNKANWTKRGKTGPNGAKRGQMGTTGVIFCMQMLFAHALYTCILHTCTLHIHSAHVPFTCTLKFFSVCTLCTLHSVFTLSRLHPTYCTLIVSSLTWNKIDNIAGVGFISMTGWKYPPRNLLHWDVWIMKLSRLFPLISIMSVLYRLITNLLTYNCSLTPHTCCAL